MEEEKILIIDFYGQYNQLIARRVRECNVYSEIVPFTISLDKIIEKKPKGIIFTGGPASVYSPNAPTLDKKIFELGIPILGICYGMQLMTNLLGGVVEKANKREYGTTKVYLDNKSKLFKGLLEENDCLMSHTDKVTILPSGFKNIANSKNCQNAGMENENKKLYGIQFHPEVNHTNRGTEIIRNFVYNVCGCKRKLEDEFICRKDSKRVKRKNR